MGMDAHRTEEGRFEKTWFSAVYGAFREKTEVENQGNMRVLLVDDSEFNLEVIGGGLSAAGVEVVTAGSGFEALDILASGQAFDAVLLDVQMPRMDGRETARRIRGDGRWAGLPVLAVTASSVKGEREKCLEAGMNDFLTKPVDFEALLGSLARWTRKEFDETAG